MSRRMPGGKIKASRSCWMVVSTSRLLTANLTLGAWKSSATSSRTCTGTGRDTRGGVVTMLMQYSATYRTTSISIITRITRWC